MKETIIKVIGAVSVRAVVTISVTGAVIYMAIQGKEIPTELFGAFGMVFTYWFVSEANDRANSDRFG